MSSSPSVSVATSGFSILNYLNSLNSFSHRFNIVLHSLNSISPLPPDFNPPTFDSLPSLADNNNNTLFEPSRLHDKSSSLSLAASLALLSKGVEAPFHHERSPVREDFPFLPTRTHTPTGGASSNNTFASLSPQHPCKLRRTYSSTSAKSQAIRSSRSSTSVFSLDSTEKSFVQDPFANLISDNANRRQTLQFPNNSSFPNSQTTPNTTTTPTHYFNNNRFATFPSLKQQQQQQQQPTSLLNLIYPSTAQTTTTTACLSRTTSEPTWNYNPQPSSLSYKKFKASESAAAAAATTIFDNQNDFLISALQQLLPQSLSRGTSNNPSDFFTATSSSSSQLTLSLPQTPLPKTTQSHQNLSKKHVKLSEKTSNQRASSFSTLITSDDNLNQPTFVTDFSIQSLFDFTPQRNKHSKNIIIQSSNIKQSNDHHQSNKISLPLLTVPIRKVSMPVTMQPVSPVINPIKRRATMATSIKNQHVFMEELYLKQISASGSIRLQKFPCFKDADLNIPEEFNSVIQQFSDDDTCSGNELLEKAVNFMHKKLVAAAIEENPKASIPDATRILRIKDIKFDRDSEEEDEEEEVIKHPIKNIKSQEKNKNQIIEEEDDDEDSNENEVISDSDDGFPLSD